MEITQLTQSSGESFVVELENGESFKTVLSVVADFSLYSGRELSDEELCEVRDASSLGKAKQRALRIIGAAALSEAALYERLVQKGESVGNAAACVSWLKDLGFLDDVEYAKNLVRHYAQKGFGRARVRDELYKRRVPRIYWDEALEQMPEQDDTIDRLLEKKLTYGAPCKKELKRATDALLRRGFSWEDVRAAISRYNDTHNISDTIEEDY